MDATTTETTQPNDFSSNHGILIFLLVIFVLAVLGLNLFSVLANIFDELAKTFVPMAAHVFALFGYSTGELIDNTAVIAADTAKLGVDIAQGTAQDIGNLLKNASQGGMSEKEKQDLDKLLSSRRGEASCPEPEPVKSDDKIEKPIASQKSKAGWCFVGEYDGTRGCVELEEHEKCMSGQVFPSQKMCLNPNLTP